MADDNNYVKNGSFEADRKRVPSNIKPVQMQLTSWVTHIIEGNQVSLDSAHSPSLNAVNSESDRRVVIGEKSLHISDQSSFKRKIFQVIASSPYVKLEEGLYTLNAKVKNSARFTNLSMYALSNGRIFKHNIKQENTSWQTISIKNISIHAGKVEIGFQADGEANAFCYVDDVSLVKAR